MGAVGFYRNINTISQQCTDIHHRVGPFQRVESFEGQEVAAPTTVRHVSVEHCLQPIEEVAPSEAKEEVVDM